MRYWKFSQKTKLKQKFFTNNEKRSGKLFQDWEHSARLLPFSSSTSHERIRITTELLT